MGRLSTPVARGQATVARTFSSTEAPTREIASRSGLSQSTNNICHTPVQSTNNICHTPVQTINNICHTPVQTINNICRTPVQTTSACGARTMRQSGHWLHRHHRGDARHPRGGLCHILRHRFRFLRRKYHSFRLLIIRFCIMCRWCYIYIYIYIYIYERLLFWRLLSIINFAQCQGSLVKRYVRTLLQGI